ncbi:unnamed protein product, partial [Pelagomonas calceolata]
SARAPRRPPRPRPPRSPAARRARRRRQARAHLVRERARLPRAAGASTPRRAPRPPPASRPAAPARGPARPPRRLPAAGPPRRRRRPCRAPVPPRPPTGSRRRKWRRRASTPCFAASRPGRRTGRRARPLDGAAPRSTISGARRELAAAAPAAPAGLPYLSFERRSPVIYLELCLTAIDHGAYAIHGREQKHRRNQATFTPQMYVSFWCFRGGCQCDPAGAPPPAPPRGQRHAPMTASHAKFQQQRCSGRAATVGGSIRRSTPRGPLSLDL